MIAVVPAKRGDLIAARWSISTVFLFNGAGIGLWAAHIPLVQAKFALDEKILGIVLLCFAVGAICTMPLAGLASIYFGSRRATQVMALAFAFILPTPMLAPTIASLFLAAFIFGSFNGALDVVMNAHASEVEAARGESTMASFHGFFSIGGMVGATVGGISIGAGLGDGGGALLAAGMMIIILLPTTSHLLKGSAIDRSHCLRFGWPRRAALLLGLMALLCMMVEGAVADWSALLLTQHTGTSDAFAATGYAGFSIAMAVCRFTGDFLINYLGPRQMTIIGGASIAVGLLLAALLSQPLAAASAFALVGLGAANIVPVIFTAAARIPGIAPGVGVATAATIGYIGFLVGPPAIGLIASVTNLPAAFGLLAIAGIIIAFFARAVEGSRT